MPGPAVLEPLSCSHLSGWHTSTGDIFPEPQTTPSKKSLQMLYVFRRQRDLLAPALRHPMALKASLSPHQTRTLSGKAGVIRPQQPFQVPPIFPQGVPGSASRLAPSHADIRSQSSSPIDTPQPLKATSSGCPRPSFLHGHTTLQSPDVPEMISGFGLWCLSKA